MSHLVTIAVDRLVTPESMDRAAAASRRPE